MILQNVDFLTAHLSSGTFCSCVYLKKAKGKVKKIKQLQAEVAALQESSSEEEEEENPSDSGGASGVDEDPFDDIGNGFGL